MKILILNFIDVFFMFSFVSVFNNVIIKPKQDNIINFVNDLQSIIDLKLYDDFLIEL